MLYLAEVQKRGGGLLGGSKAELRLLACQRSEQSWSAVPGDEVIPADEANDYGPGALVLMDLTPNKQIRNLQPAARQLVSILQNFSRLQEKFKSQEEEIEQWKQSLTYQSQELNRREMEMEARREQLQQLEDDFERLEQQRQELESLREQVTQQSEEYERNRQELDGAWNHLRGEMNRLEERQAELQHSTVMDESQAQAIQALLNRLSAAIPVTDELQQQLGGSVEVLNQKQELLGYHWQNLEYQRSLAQQLQGEFDQQATDVQNQWQSWRQAQAALEQARAELNVQQTTLGLRQEYARMLGVQLQNHEDLHQQVYRLVDTSEQFGVSHQVDMDALEKMPIGELQKLVQDLEHDLGKLSQFVASQEEELNYKQQEIDALQVKINAANDFDRMNLENELTDERDGYQMLNETLVGQRRSLRERESVLAKHQLMLCRRQGLPLPSGREPAIDLGPVLSQIDAHRQQQAEEVQKLENQIEQMRGAIQQAESMITEQSAEQEAKRAELEQFDASLLERKATVAEAWGKVALYQDMLQPVQDRVDALRQQLEAMTGGVNQVQEGCGSQVATIDEMRQLVARLTGAAPAGVS